MLQPKVAYLDLKDYSRPDQIKCLSSTNDIILQSSTRDRRNGYRVVRSSSDNSANLLRPPTLQRQHSQASSDRGSNNSDDYYADGLYQGECCSRFLEIVVGALGCCLL